MHPMRLAALVTAIGVAACDPTVQVRTGNNNGGGSGRHALAFVTQPTDAAAGAVLSPAVQVAVRDTLGNADPSFAGFVTIAVGSNPTGGFLEGTTTAVLVSGIARFGNLAIDKAGSGYTLVASAPGAAPATSAAFAIVAAAR
jgi:hypothetical protein